MDNINSENCTVEEITIIIEDDEEEEMSSSVLSEVKEKQLKEEKIYTAEADTVNKTSFLNEQSKDDKFYCYKCSYETPFKSNLKRHVRFHEDAKRCLVLKCKRCGYKTISRNLLKSHQCLRNHAEKLKNQQDQTDCDNDLDETSSTSKSTKRLAKPRRIVNVTNKYSFSKGYLKGVLYNCVHCNSKSARKHDMLRHIRCHTIPDSEASGFRCPNCHFQAKNRSALTKHVRVRHNGPQETTLECPKCDYVTMKLNRFNQHLKIHDNDGGTSKIGCLQQKSMKKSSSKNSSHQKVQEEETCIFTMQTLIEHVLKKDKPMVSKKKLPIKSIKCTHCDYQTPFLDAFKYHQRSHRKKKGQSGSCLLVFPNLELKTCHLMK